MVYDNVHIYCMCILGGQLGLYWSELAHMFGGQRAFPAVLYVVQVITLCVLHLPEVSLRCVLMAMTEGQECEKVQLCRCFLSRGMLVSCFLMSQLPKQVT